MLHEYNGVTYKQKHASCKSKTFVYCSWSPINWEITAMVAEKEKIKQRGTKMKKVMLAAVVAFAMVCGVYAAEEAKAGATCPAADAKKAAVCCEACAKLAKDAKAGEQAKLCDACTKKCAAKAAPKAE
jgi:hypothetical protein